MSIQHDARRGTIFLFVMKHNHPDDACNIGPTN
jgi:hypothetical protein